MLAAGVSAKAIRFDDLIYIYMIVYTFCRCLNRYFYLLSVLVRVIVSVGSIRLGYCYGAWIDD